MSVKELKKLQKVEIMQHFLEKLEAVRTQGSPPMTDPDDDGLEQLQKQLSEAIAKRKKRKASTTTGIEAKRPRKEKTKRKKKKK